MKEISRPFSSTQVAALKREYDRTGMVSQSFKLADTSLLAAVKQDGPIFKKAITELRSQGHFRVPYIFTEAIEAIALDETLVGVVQAIFGQQVPWVMWGPNMQQGTPNEAYSWHVDIESWHWPTITVVIGLENCKPENATRCIPYSHLLDLLPWSEADNTVDASVQASATSWDERCNTIRSFDNFQTGNFYVFNAKTWHCGPALSMFQDRKLLIFHYQRADDPRIPYMYDYEKRLWFDYPAAYGEGPSHNNVPLGPDAKPLNIEGAVKRFRTDLYPLPKGHGLGA